MVKKFWLTEDPIDVTDVMERVVRPEAGAISTFIGIAREYTNGKRTLFLEYQAYPSMAEKMLQKIGKEVEENWGNASIAIVHRIGRLEISEIAVAIAVSTPHRKEAFAASHYAINRIKELVPIWKKEYWEDGSEWIGNQQETQSYEIQIPTKEDIQTDG